MPSELVENRRKDANAEGGLMEVGPGRLEKTGFLMFVESTEIVLTKPIEVYLQFEEGYAHWVASFCPATISAAGKTPRDAIEELRALLVFICESWITEKELPEAWRWLPPKMLGVLEGYFARRGVDA